MATPDAVVLAQASGIELDDVIFGYLPGSRCCAGFPFGGGG